MNASRKKIETNGPGKYDWLASHVRKESSARMVAVIIKGGSLGDGFSVQSLDADLVLQLPDFLEGMARQIRAQQNGGNP